MSNNLTDFKLNIDVFLHYIPAASIITRAYKILTEFLITHEIISPHFFSIW